MLKEHNEQLVSFIEWLATQYSFALSLALDKPDEPFIALRLARMRDEWANVEIPTTQSPALGCSGPD